LHNWLPSADAEYKGECQQSRYPKKLYQKGYILNIPG